MQGAIPAIRIEVMIMAFQRGLRQRPTQCDLFDPPEVAPPVATPAWQLLPEGARLTATKLMARLLVDHERADREERRAGGRGDV
jgi:hypothetical protein